MTQEILVYVLLGVALLYLGYKFWSKKDKKSDCGKGTDCGCG